MNLTHSEKNTINSLDYVIRSLNLKITSKTLKEQLYLHPEFPSLLSLSDTLRKWNIPNIATRIYYKELVNIPLPAIAFIEINGGIFAPIRSATETEIEWLDTQKGWQRESLEDFASKWGNGNVVLLLEPNEKSKEDNYSKNRTDEILELLKVPFIFAGLGILMLLLGYSFRSYFINTSWEHIALIIVKLIGTIVSSILIWQSIDSENTFIRSICGGDSKNDCNSILNSNASKLFGWLRWSEIGLFYFAGGFILSLFVLFDKANILIQYLWVANILALPYTVYSIYYQYFIARIWCRLCLAVQLLLWCEFIIGLFAWDSLSLTSGGIPLFLFSYLIPIVLYVFIKKPIENKNLVLPLRRELQKSKFNSDYINSLFEKQKTIPPIFNGMKTINIGNTTSENKVTIVTNPMCGPCKKLHKEIENFLSKKGSEISFCFSFVFTGGEGAIKIAQTIFSLPENQQANAMHLWYSGKFNSIDDWTNKIDIANIEKSATEQVSFHQRWAEIAEIGSTPTILLNDKELPLLYGLNDIEDIIENIYVLD